MSHVVEIRTEVRDPLAVRMACSRLGLAAPWSGYVRLFLAKPLLVWLCSFLTGAIRGL